jgi:hypothetical protein
MLFVRAGKLRVRESRERSPFWRHDAPKASATPPPPVGALSVRKEIIPWNNGQRVLILR